MSAKKIAIDLGASELKSGALGKTNKPILFHTSPYCALSTRERCESLYKEWGDGLSKESGWVFDPEFMHQHYLLGRIAKTNYGSRLQEGERKNAKALYQILGVVGAFAKHFNLPQNSDLALGVLLPFAEYSTSTALKKNLEIALKRFIYCGNEYKFNLDSIIVRPEGFGTLMKGLPKGITLEGKFASLMLGYRNASWLLTIDKSPDISQSETTDLGYRWVVQRVMTRLGHTDEELVLTNLLDQSDREINTILPDVLKEYIYQLKAWISSKAKVDNLIISGGTAFHLRELISELIPNAIWPDEFHQSVIPYGLDESMAWRYIDPLGLLFKM